MLVVDSISLVSSAEEASSPSTPCPGSPGGRVASDDGSPTVVWDLSVYYKFREKRTKKGKEVGRKGTERVSQLKASIVYKCLCDYLYP